MKAFINFKKKYYFLDDVKPPKSEDTIDKQILKIKAQRNPSTFIPVTKYPAKRIIKALITNEKSPKVIIVKGKPKIDKIGFTKILSKAKIIAKKTAVLKDSICTPDKKYFESTNATIAVVKRRIMNFICLI